MNIRNSVPNDHIQSISEIAKSQSSMIQLLTIEIQEKDKEIGRLNNIIDELEEWCLSWKENDKYCYLSSNDKDKCRYDIWEEVLDKLKELTGSDKDEENKQEN